MNGTNDSNQTDNIHEPKTVAFCQNCGKSLDQETIRKVGPAIYCEPCLAARLAGTPASAPSGAGGYVPVNPGMPFSAPGAAAPNSSEPNPGLAALLGLIPGVGAMYNEQYAKGLVHLVIFAVLIMFSHISGIFILFVFGWIFYMAIEAHHTAKARRDGLPLPNPFNLNDIGERMGFGTAWPNGPDVASAARDAVHAAATGFQSAPYHAGYQARPSYPTAPPPPASGTVPEAAPASTWGAPVDAYAAPAAANPSPANPSYAAPPYSPTFGAPVVPPVSTPLPPQSSFPVGAALLIGLGVVFLLGTMNVFRAVPAFALIGAVLLVLGVWIFLRRMTETGQPIAYDATPDYSLRVLRALQGSVWLIAVGILTLLHSFRVVSWYYSWPCLIILGGVMMILQRAAYNAAAAAYSAADPSTTGPATGSSIQGGN